MISNRKLVTSNICIEDDTYMTCQEIYNNVFSLDDLLNVFHSIKNNIIQEVSTMYCDSSDKLFTWSSMFSSDICGKITKTSKIKCLGCILLSRFNSSGDVTNCTFQLKGGSHEGELFRIEVKNKSNFTGYRSMNKEEYTDLTEFDDTWKCTTRNMICEGEPVEHYIFISSLVSSILPMCNEFVWTYLCKDRCVLLKRGYNYGISSFDTMIGNEFTSNIDIKTGKRYLSEEVIEGLLFQLHNIFYSLSYHLYTHGNPSLTYLAFSDSKYLSDTKCYSFTVHLLCSEYDTIVKNGIKYMISPSNELQQKVPEMNDEEYISYHRNHSGWHIDSGKYDFYKMLSSLKKNPTFSSSVQRYEHLYDIIYSKTCWNDLCDEGY